MASLWNWVWSASGDVMVADSHQGISNHRQTRGCEIARHCGMKHARDWGLREADVEGVTLPVSSGHRRACLVLILERTVREVMAVWVHVWWFSWFSRRTGSVATHSHQDSHLALPPD